MMREVIAPGLVKLGPLQSHHSGHIGGSVKTLLRRLKQPDVLVNEMTVMAAGLSKKQVAKARGEGTVEASESLEADELNPVHRHR